MDKIKLIVMDMDGTLLDSDKNISSYTMDLLKGLTVTAINLVLLLAGQL